MARRSLAMQVAITVILFAAYLGLYAVLDGAGLNAQREETVDSLRLIARISGLIVAGVAAIWAIFLSFVRPGEYQVKLSIAVIVGLAMWFYL